MKGREQGQSITRANSSKLCYDFMKFDKNDIVIESTIGRLGSDAMPSWAKVSHFYLLVCLNGPLLFNTKLSV